MSNLFKLDNSLRLPPLLYETDYFWESVTQFLKYSNIVYLCDIFKKHTCEEYLINAAESKLKSRGYRGYDHYIIEKINSKNIFYLPQTLYLKYVELINRKEILKYMALNSENMVDFVRVCTDDNMKLLTNMKFYDIDFMVKLYYYLDSKFNFPNYKEDARYPRRRFGDRKLYKIMADPINVINYIKEINIKQLPNKWINKYKLKNDISDHIYIDFILYLIQIFHVDFIQTLVYNFNELYGNKQIFMQKINKEKLKNYSWSNKNEIPMDVVTMDFINLFKKSDNSIDLHICLLFTQCNISPEVKKTLLYNIATHLHNNEIVGDEFDYIIFIEQVKLKKKFPNLVEFCFVKLINFDEKEIRTYFDDLYEIILEKENYNIFDFYIRDKVTIEDYFIHQLLCKDQKYYYQFERYRNISINHNIFHICKLAKNKEEYIEYFNKFLLNKSPVNIMQIYDIFIKCGLKYQIAYLDTKPDYNNFKNAIDPTSDYNKYYTKVYEKLKKKCNLTDSDINIIQVNIRKTYAIKYGIKEEFKDTFMNHLIAYHNKYLGLYASNKNVCTIVDIENNDIIENNDFIENTYNDDKELEYINGMNNLVENLIRKNTIDCMINYDSDWILNSRTKDLINIFVTNLKTLKDDDKLIGYLLSKETYHKLPIIYWLFRDIINITKNIKLEQKDPYSLNDCKYSTKLLSFIQIYFNDITLYNSYYQINICMGNNNINIMDFIGKFLKYMDNKTKKSILNINIISYYSFRQSMDASVNHMTLPKKYIHYIDYYYNNKKMYYGFNSGFLEILFRIIKYENTIDENTIDKNTNDNFEVMKINSRDIVYDDKNKIIVNIHDIPCDDINIINKLINFRTTSQIGNDLSILTNIEYELEILHFEKNRDYIFICPKIYLNADSEQLDSRKCEFGYILKLDSPEMINDIVQQTYTFKYNEIFLMIIYEYALEKKMDCQWIHNILYNFNIYKNYDNQIKVNLVELDDEII